MGAASSLSDLRTTYRERIPNERPFFIDERGWEIFSAYVFDGIALQEIAARYGTSIRRLRLVLVEVDRQLCLPRNSGREWTQVTANSPVEDLGLSVRARNQLHDLGCNTVEDVLRLDLSTCHMGRRSRHEVLESLKRWGFRQAAEAGRASDLQRVSAQLRDLRDQIDENARLWRNKVDGIEARLQRLTKVEN